MKLHLSRELVLNFSVKSWGKDPVNEVLLIACICLGCNLTRGSGTVWTTRPIHHYNNHNNNNNSFFILSFQVHSKHFRCNLNRYCARKNGYEGLRLNLFPLGIAQSQHFYVYLTFKLKFVHSRSFLCLNYCFHI